jgi:predicted Zn-dependent protease
LLRRAVACTCALAFGLSAVLQPAAAQNNLPALGDSDSADFSVGAERKIGDEIMREIRVDPDYIDDPLLFEYLQSVWDPLVAAGRRLGNITADIDQRFAWQPFLVRDPSVNAFALPGGFVGVHLGLIAITVTRDELASVLGHEMSHVSQRHIARSITGSSRRSLVSLAALIIGLLAASRSNNPDAINAVVTGTQAASIQSQLNFSRDMEREADRIGFQVMVAAGFAPGGMASMFEKMETSNRLNDFGGFPYLRTHPLTVERIGEARSRASLAATGPRVSVLEHTVAQARARILMDKRVDALRRWQGRDADVEGSAADKLLNLYESAEASSLLRDWARADAAFAKALAITRASPNSSTRAERAVALTQAQSLLDRGAPAKAKELCASPATARAPLCCYRRRSPWPRSRRRPTAPIKARAGDLHEPVGAPCRLSARLRIARPDLGAARPAAALRAEANRAMRSAIARPVDRFAPRSGSPQRRPGRFLGCIGGRFAAAISRRSAGRSSSSARARPIRGHPKTGRRSELAQFRGRHEQMFGTAAVCKGLRSSRYRAAIVHQPAGGRGPTGHGQVL